MPAIVSKVLDIWQRNRYGLGIKKFRCVEEGVMPLSRSRPVAVIGARAPTFLLRTGYEQVRSVAAALAGDWDAARQVELVLPETGVCNRSDAPGRADSTAAGACCASGSPHEFVTAVEATATAVSSDNGSPAISLETRAKA